MQIIWRRNCCMFSSPAQPNQQLFFSSSMQFLSIKNQYTSNADNLDKKLLHVLLSMASYFYLLIAGELGSQQADENLGCGNGLL